MDDGTIDVRLVVPPDATATPGVDVPSATPPGSDLPRTGSDVLLTAVLAVALLVLGWWLVRAGRSRTS